MLLLVAFLLSITSSELLVVVVTMSGAGALQLMPGICGVCFPGRRLLTRTGVGAGIAVGLVVLYSTTIIYPHPLTLHGGVWALVLNWVTAWAVSRVTRAPSARTVGRIHGALEEFVYGTGEPERQK